jgi:hypothetical protein
MSRGSWAAVELTPDGAVTQDRRQPCVVRQARYDASMTWVLPTELLPIAGLLALVGSWPRVRTSLSSGRLFGQVFAITLPIIGLVWLG